MPVHSFVICRLGIGAVGDAIEGGAAPDSSSLFHIDPGAALVIVPLALFPLCEVLVLLVFSLYCACVRRSAMPKDVSKEDPDLPFPGKYGPTGFATQYIRL